MSTRTMEATTLRGIVEEWFHALHEGDVEALTQNYAEDVRFATLAPPLWTRGRESYKSAIRGWLSTFDGPLSGEAEDLSVVEGEALAFVNGLSHIVGKKKDGHQMDVRQRLTLCFEKRNGTWMVVAEHTSVPFDMQTFQPLVGLRA